MTRIRYNEKNGLLVSKELILNNDVIVAQIDVQNKSFHIMSVANELVLASGSGNTLSSLKLHVKKQLKNMGMHFDHEVRYGSRKEPNA